MGAPLGRSTLGVGLLLLSLLRPAVGAAGPSTQKPTLRIERIATSPPTKVRIYLSDLDENGLVIPPATPRPYQLLVNGQRLPNAAQVETFGKLGEPMALTMVIQCSPIFGSAFGELKAGLLQLLDLVPPSSQVGLIAYADGVISELKPTSVKAARDALQALQIKEDAIELELPDGVRDGLAQLSQANLPERRVLVVVSDGLAAELKFGAFTKLGGDAASRGIRIHAVGYAPIDDTPLRTLTELSKRSGGTMRPSTNVPDMKAALVALADELRHQRVLEYDLPQLFTGKVTDFQIEAGADLATDAVQIDLPLVEPPGFAHWGLVLAIAGGLLFLAGGVVLMTQARRRQVASAQAVLQDMKSAAPASLEHTGMIKGMQITPSRAAEGRAEGKVEVRGVPKKPAPNAAKPEPKAAAKVEVKAPAPKPVVKDDDEIIPTLSMPPAHLEQPSLEESEAETRPPPGPRSPDANNELALPSPTQFLRIAKGDAKAPEPVISTMGSLSAKPSLPPVALPNLGGAPLSAPSSEQSTIDPLSKKTQVLSASEVESVDVAAWLVPLHDGPRTTLVLRPGYVVGDGGDFRVGSATSRPSSARFDLDGLGRWVMVTRGDDGQERRRVLKDDERIHVGDTELLVKIATRFRMDSPGRQPYLVVVGGPDDGAHVPLENGVTSSIGAHPRAEVMVRGPGVGGIHAAARLDGQVCQIADLGAEAGLEFGGKPVGLATLRDGQEVRVGSVRLVFRVP